MLSKRNVFYWFCWGLFGYLAYSAYHTEINEDLWDPYSILNIATVHFLMLLIGFYPHYD